MEGGRGVWVPWMKFYFSADDLQIAFNLVLLFFSKHIMNNIIINIIMSIRHLEGEGRGGVGVPGMNLYFSADDPQNDEKLVELGSVKL